MSQTNNYPPLNLDWKPETRPMYKEGVENLVITASGVIVATLLPIHSGWWFGKKKTEYLLRFVFRNANGNIIGGYFPTVEEAKDYAVKTATLIFRGWNFVPPVEEDAANV